MVGGPGEVVGYFGMGDEEGFAGERVVEAGIYQLFVLFGIGAVDLAVEDAVDGKDETGRVPVGCGMDIDSVHVSFFRRVNSDRIFRQNFFIQKAPPSRAAMITWIR
jgi:hypothetical protein